MIYNTILSYRYKQVFKLIASLLVFSLILYLSGCTTSETHRVRSENLAYETDYEIINIIMKDGLVIDLKDKSTRFEKEWNDKKNVIIYTSLDTIWLSERSYKLFTETKVIELDDIMEITIEKTETDVGWTIVAGIGILAAFVIVILLVSADDDPPSPPPPPPKTTSCPYVYSFDGEKYVFDAEPTAGAITEGLKKTDYSMLEHLKPVNGKYKILIKNETEETHYIDKVDLLVIDHAINTEVTSDINGNMTVYNNIQAPLSVIDENGKYLTSLFKSKDDYKWQSILPSENTFTDENLRHKLIFKFPRPENAKDVKLYVSGGTSMWGGMMVERMLDLYGNKVDEWYNKINNKEIELFELFQFHQKEELFLLKVNVLENTNWITKGYIQGGSPYKHDDRILDLNLENIPGDTLTIELNPPLGFWKIDQIGLIYDELPKPDINEISISYAKDHEGNDLCKTLNTIDCNYHEMLVIGNYADVWFDVPLQDKGTKRTLFLKINGYYEIHLKKDKPEQIELIDKIMNTPGYIVKFAMEEYFKTKKQLEAIIQ